jgi:hypothetical protein
VNLLVISPQHKAWLDGVRQVDEERRAMALETRAEMFRSAREAWANDVLDRAFSGRSAA